MAATGRDVSIRFDDNLHDLSLQGPLAVDYLAKHVPGIRDLPYFHHMQTQLFGLPVMISRTGYTGERGYEIFCRGQDAGDDLGPHPRRRQAAWASSPAASPRSTCCASKATCCSSPSTIREMYPFDDEGPGDTLWELGLDFTVTPGKTGFRGAEEHYRLKGKERFKICGVLLEGTEPADEGAPVYRRRQAGRRRHLRHVFAAGQEIDGHRPPAGRLRRARARRSRSATRAASIKATTQPLPFDDPEEDRSARRRADGDNRRGTHRDDSGEWPHADSTPRIKSRPGLRHAVAPAGHATICSSPTARAPRRSSTWPGPRRDGFFAGAADHLHARADRRPLHRPRCRRWRRRSCYEGPTIAAALPRLRQMLADAHMGLRVYLAGTEGLIGQACSAAIEAGIDHAVDPDRTSRLARAPRAVRALQGHHRERHAPQPVICSHCGLHLFVRDHYSRRIAAFQGVNIDAEDPSERAADRGEVPMSAGATKLDVVRGRGRRRSTT